MFGAGILDTSYMRGGRAHSDKEHVIAGQRKFAWGEGRGVASADTAVSITE